MLSKSFALFIAFAPAFAAPVPDVLGVTASKCGDPIAAYQHGTFLGGSSNVYRGGTSLEQRGNSECSVADVTAIVDNVLNNGTFSILSQSKRGDCDVVGVTAEVKNVLNGLNIQILSQSKRNEGYCSLADIEAIVTDVANDMKTSVLSQSKRSSCDVVKVTAIVKNLLKNLDVKVLTQSKRSTDRVANIDPDTVDTPDDCDSCSSRSFFGSLFSGLFGSDAFGTPQPIDPPYKQSFGYGSL